MRMEVANRVKDGWGDGHDMRAEKNLFFVSKYDEVN